MRSIIDISVIKYPIVACSHAHCSVTFVHKQAPFSFINNTRLQRFMRVYANEYSKQHSWAPVIGIFFISKLMFRRQFVSFN